MLFCLHFIPSLNNKRVSLKMSVDQDYVLQGYHNFPSHSFKSKIQHAKFSTLTFCRNSITVESSSIRMILIKIIVLYLRLFSTKILWICQTYCRRASCLPVCNFRNSWSLVWTTFYFTVLDMLSVEMIVVPVYQTEAVIVLISCLWGNLR